MSTTVAMIGNRVAVTRYAGPLLKDEKSRIRVQLTDTRTEQYVTFSLKEWTELTHIDIFAKEIDA